MPEAARLLTNLATETDRWLASALDDAASEWPAPLADAVRYALLGGGKRLRPALALLWCEASGTDRAAAMPAGAAIECVHAFSLVHDDLPSMDDDDLRRGRPTLHVHAGEAMAVLAGDILQTLAFELAATHAPSADVALAWTRALSEGTAGMIGGQVLDTIGGHAAGQSDLDRLRTTHAGKTGALIHAACRCGAIAAGSEHIEAANVYARTIGLMFQAVDDLLDVEGDAATVGKRTGKDTDAGKLTYPSVLGVDGTRAEIERLLEEAVEAARAPGLEGDSLISLARWLADRSH